MVQRKKNHKCSCNNPNSKEYNSKKSKTIRDNGGWDAFRMVPLELMKNTTKFEAECREEVVRCELQANLNSRRASCFGISVQEYNRLYNEEHKDYLKEYKKIYREENGDKIREHKKKYRDENIDQIRENDKKYYQENKEQLKEKQKKYYEENGDKIREREKIYREENGDKIREREKKYRDKNRDQINAKHKEKFDCECGGKYTHTHKARHLRTQKHQLYLENET
jgi:hypothetical protein